MAALASRSLLAWTNSFEQIVTGLSIGSILLLVALGLSIIYGSMGIINLAHGEFVMLGAYAAWMFQHYFGLGLLESLVPIFLVVAICGWLIERYVLSFLNNRPLDTILATWGVGIILQQGVRLMVGGGTALCAVADSCPTAPNCWAFKSLSIESFFSLRLWRCLR